MAQKLVVKLSPNERKQLEELLSSGNANTRTIIHANILLKSDSNWTYREICDSYNVAPPTVALVRKRYLEEGLISSLYRKKPEREYLCRLNDKAESQLITLASGEPPMGEEYWTLRLLQKRMIELGYVETVSHEVIRLTLKRNNLFLSRSKKAYA